jgi:hypothetical protein
LAYQLALPTAKPSCVGVYPVTQPLSVSVLHYQRVSLNDPQINCPSGDFIKWGKSMEIPQSSSMIIIHFHRIFHDEMEKIFEEHTLRTAISAQHWSKIQLAVGTTSSTILRPIASLHHLSPKSMCEGD